MYGATIPEDDATEVISKQPPRKFQPRVVVVALCGVLIGSLGTAMLFPLAPTYAPNAPTPQPTLSSADILVEALVAMGPLRAPDDDILLEMSDDLMECKKQLKGIKKQWLSCDMQLETCAARACCVCD